MDTMASKTPQLENTAYTVGWIAALPHERAAARAMLDKTHAPPRQKNPNDRNNYTLGSINGPNGEHNVVIASFPSGRYGTTSAATAATQMLSSFPTVKVGLMVGIGGGIPSEENDIRLGDVVVSKPEGAFGGVRQYDYGKATVSGFEECGALNSPPDVLLNAMCELQSNHEMMGSSMIPEILSDMYKAYPAMADTRKGSVYVHQGAENDRLFSADCLHTGSKKDCSECNISKEIERPERPDHNPCIHYGTIASGNQVIKDPKLRDSLSDDCLCFETEAAGLMNCFPCLVIRGICDYCDSHKNDQWQRYAAATAAAYAKELLQLTDTFDIENTPDARRAVMNDLSEIKSIAKELSQSQSQTDFFKWLSPLSPSARHYENQKRRVEGTGIWLFEDPDFLDWFSESPSSRVLFCYGDPGVGKTIISSVVIDRLQELVTPESAIGVAYLYGDYRDQKEQTSENLIGTIVRQLLALLPIIPPGMMDIYKLQAKQDRPLSFPEAEKLLHMACEQFSKVYVCVDALDELNDIRSLLIALQGQSSPMQVYITGRPHIRTTLEKYIPNKREIAVQAHEYDIRKFIDREIGGPNDLEPDAMDEKLRQDIQEKVLAAAKGVFLLPVLQVRSVLQATTLRRRERALEALPSSIGDAFASTMVRIEQQPDAQSEKAQRIISWVHLAERPITVDELLCSFAVEDGDKTFNPRGIPVRDTLVDCCQGLVIIDQETCTVRLVHYSLEEYLSQQGHVFGISKVQWHSQIARTCLTFLTFLIMPTGDCIDSALLSYASAMWGHHLRKSEHLPGAPLQLAKGYLHSQLTHGRVSLRLLYDCMYGNRYRGDELCHIASSAHIAAFFGLHAIMLHLCLEGFDIDSIDVEGLTPLSWAAKCGHKPVVNLLLEKGVEIDSRDATGKTPLLLALRAAHESVAKSLINKGTSVDVKDNLNNTAMSYAAENNCEEIAKILVERCAPIDIKNEFGLTPLLLAVQGGFQPIFELLLAHGAAVESMDGYGRTALIFAVSCGFETMVKLLLKNGANVEAFDRKYGRTPLIWATAEGNETMARLLIEKGAAVDAVDAGFGWTPLLWTSVKGFEPIAKLLLENGAAIAPVERDGYGRTPLLLALEARNDAVVRLLIENGAATDIHWTSHDEQVNWVDEKGLDGLMDLLGFTTDHSGHRSKKVPNAKDPVDLYFD
ncbi:hypothetical protein BDV25DRAFT_169222 [Aspergillus avenaceus]|uniref:Ankyrin repeat-containing domain protein n=1 Tax=Aspergillus avenaceus TaxID=36643 RepID=A0A5N6TMI0_ASPAV|nr:hypothetical protein BDV25DRAFT_169222 [Aspergillus avenaceus]